MIKDFATLSNRTRFDFAQLHVRLPYRIVSGQSDECRLFLPTHYA